MPAGDRRAAQPGTAGGDHIFPNGDNAEQTTAIERRHRAVHVTTPLQRDGPLSREALYARYLRTQQ